MDYAPLVCAQKVYLISKHERLILGSIPQIDELFPPRPTPVRRAPPEELLIRPVPTATGAGFFTPDAGNAGNIFRGWKPDPPVPQAFRMDPPTGLREST